MSDRSIVLSLPYIQGAQAQKHVTHNEALRVLDVLVQAAVTSRNLRDAPANAAQGDRYIVAAGGLGAWEGQDGAIAVFEGSYWTFIAPKPGWQVNLLDEDTSVVFNGTEWRIRDGGAGTSGSNETLGVNTTADDTNRLSVSADATLLSHDGTDHRLKVNKADVPDTASLLFQSGFSGRAEMGLTGSDDFAIKVSLDGASFVDAMRFDAATGIASGAAIQSDATDETSGRLMRAEWGVLREGLVGQLADEGEPATGAVVDSGSNADGQWVRFADGTQICSLRDVTLDGGTGQWVFPQRFVSSGTVSVVVTSTSTTICRIATGRSTSATRAALALFDTDGAPTSGGISAVAHGRWF